MRKYYWSVAHSTLWRESESFSSGQKLVRQTQQLLMQTEKEQIFLILKG